ncbi:nitrogen regulatory protein PII [Clostridiales Family XIII bacterium PM5-7]
MFSYEVIFAIVNGGMGSRVMRKAKTYGVSGGTVFLARGSANDFLSKFLSLDDEPKEVVLMGADHETATTALQKLSVDFRFDKPNHGIAFSISLCGVSGSRKCKYEQKELEREEGEIMYHMITTIVNRGSAEDVIEAAVAAGSKGGTIINARGSGVNETTKVFNIEIEPEKEIVLILSAEETSKAIVESITSKLNMDQPGNGIVFVQTVNEVHGIYQETK